MDSWSHRITVLNYSICVTRTHVKSLLLLLEAGLHGEVEGRQRPRLLTLANEQGHQAGEPFGRTPVGVVRRRLNELLWVLRVEERQHEVQGPAARHVLHQINISSEETDRQEGVVLDDAVAGEGQGEEPVVGLFDDHGSLGVVLAVHGTVG